ncbi:MAG: hypothetical protein HQK51_19455, partial [Oligoflexia bacterium]|nr:hypothetical protein [Oligoflexia bacterium]
MMRKSYLKIHSDIDVKLLIRHFIFVALLFLSISTILSDESRANIVASTVSQDFFKTHVRLSFNVKRDEILINQRGQEVLIETLNITLFDKIKGDLERIKLADRYFSEISFSSEGYPEKAATVKLLLVDKNIDVFSFYKDGDKKYIVDFWENKEVKTEGEVDKVKYESKNNSKSSSSGTLIPEAKDPNDDEDNHEDSNEDE